MDIKKEDDRSADYQVIRRYAHDMRNDINAIKLGVVFLESQKLSDDVEATIHRITRQLAHSEMLLQFLALRFEEPTLQALTAMDLYTMWAARCRDTQAHRNISWDKAETTALIEGDLGILASALSEMLTFCAEESCVAAIQKQNDKVVYSVVWCEDDRGKPTLTNMELPGFGRMIARNGGSFQKNEFEGGLRCSCSFPIIG